MSKDEIPDKWVGAACFVAHCTWRSGVGSAGELRACVQPPCRKAFRTAPQRPAPRRNGFVYFIFVLLGTGTLLPWNVFLTEKEFYDVRMHVAPFNAYITGNFMSLFCLVFNTA